VKFSELPSHLRIYLVASALAAGATWLGARHLHGREDTDLLLVLLLVAPFAGGVKVHLSVRWGRMTLGLALAYFTLLALGVPQAALVNVLTAIGGLALNRRHGPRRIGLQGVPLYQLCFNVSNHVLSVVAGGVVYHALGGQFGALQLRQAVLPVLASTVVYYLVNTVGTATAVAWSQRLSPRRVWWENFLWTGPGYLASASAAALVMLFYQQWGAGVLFLFPPFYLVAYSWRIHQERVESERRHMAQINEINESVIASLAMAMDAKDHNTCSHVRRVQEYSMAIARRLALPEAELQAVRIASILHDIGKVGIPEHILCKPDKLTGEEFDLIKQHVEIGAAILEPVPFPWPVVPIVRSHHERWDGNGYPQGLAGEEIPLGGRIVSLADVFDALTAARAYRGAMSREQAIALIRAQAGTQFDPRVVEALVEALPEVEERIRQIEAEVEASNGFGSPTLRLPHSIPIDGTVDPSEREALERAALAREEAFARSEVAELLTARPEKEAILALIGAKVEKLVPACAWALYVPTDTDEELEPIASAGMHPDLFRGLRIRKGEGATGWAAAHEETVINASAALDLARRLRPTELLELNTALAMPLVVDGLVVGVLTLYHSGYSFYQPHHVRLLSLIAEHAAPALDRALAAERNTYYTGRCAGVEPDDLLTYLRR